MKLPSIGQIGAEYGRTIQRFPLVILSALIATITAIIMVEYGEPPRPSILYKILLASILALPLLTTLKLSAEKWKLPLLREWGLQVAGFILLIAYALTVPTGLNDAPMIYLFRFFAFAVGLCLLFSILPFARQGAVNGFWQFIKIIVFRVVLTGAFAAVLFAGLGLALAALDNLFGMNIPGERYFELWILINGLFTVGFILAGIPDDLDALDSITEYPKGLKVFAQYVLAPLVLVYFVILYAYIAKIIATWNWPQGWVGRLILGFSSAGILALFVLDPIREQIGQNWIKRAARWYYIILLPLVVVLFLALARRISEYGMTEDRYLGVVSGLWLAIIAGYFILSKAKSIKIIPASLCLLTFLISFGPWGMFAVSEKSQITRLHDILVANSILANGTVQKAPGEVSNRDVGEISSILGYLHEVHGYDDIQSWFAENLRLDSGEAHGFKDAASVAELMGVRFEQYHQGGPANSYAYHVNQQIPIIISEYDHLVRAGFNGPQWEKSVTKPDESCQILTGADSLTLIVMRQDSATDSLVIGLRPLFGRLIEEYGNSYGREIPTEMASTEGATERLRAKVIIQAMFLQTENDTIRPSSYDALILYSRVL